jgi:hypothetical protein
MPKFKMTTRLTILILTILFTCSVKGQVNDTEIRQQVLEKNSVDSLFIFGKWTESGQTETHLKYLGEVSTTDGRIFKIMNSCWFWGLSHRATSRILIYNDKNQYIGNYGLGMTYDLPDKLENGYLVFTNFDNRDCDKKLITKVNFIKGLPKEIFIKCKGEYGDSYYFATE